MTEESHFTRRSFSKAGSIAAISAVAASLGVRLGAADEAAGSLKGNVKHSACKWCYSMFDIALEDLCVAGKEMGLESIDLLDVDDFATVKKHGLHCAMVSFPIGEVGGKKVGGIPRAFNRVEYHDALIEAYKPHIKATAAAGFSNVICFSGNRAGLDDEAGLENCAVGLKRLMSLCEKEGVTLVMELLNSKVNHKDYQADHTAWGAELCQRVGSEHFKLLYDIYHMQIMEGDVIATIREFQEFIAHYHTGGVPGRNEIDDTQELNYPAIVKTVVETGFDGYVAQEFIPAREDKLASLKQGVTICDV